ncbi:hypothetical protein ASF93_08015 [Microbacterium sp. Leaf347]|nr:hypothetical protein ASF93_08015 [Microbacterium sp. Leaf347]KQS01271.1 hypothetical protein ASG00_10840 [Microbacterium sp. Leaf351]OJU77002.1 MAG: hypothetical protein BGO15_05720 [Microbacterium sp. 71-23]
MVDWILDVLDGITAAQFVVWAAAVIAALTVAVRSRHKVWASLKSVHTWLGGFIRLVETIGTLANDMAEVKHELQHNGGGSVKDATARTEAAVNELRATVDHIKRQNAALKTTVRRVDKALVEHIEGGGS